MALQESSYVPIIAGVTLIIVSLGGGAALAVALIHGIVNVQPIKGFISISFYYIVVPSALLAMVYIFFTGWKMIKFEFEVGSGEKAASGHQPAVADMV